MRRLQLDLHKGSTRWVQTQLHNPLRFIHANRYGQFYDRHPTMNNLYKHQLGHSSFVELYIFLELNTQQVQEDTQ